MLEKIQQKFLHTPKNLSTEEYRSLVISNLLYCVCVLIHAFLIFLFYLIKVYPMVIFNLFSVCVFITNLVLNNWGKRQLAYFFAICEILTHACLATIYVGWWSNFPFYAISLLVVNSLCSPSKAKNRVIEASITTLVILGLFLFCTFSPPVYQINPLVQRVIGAINLVTICAAIIITCMFYFKTTEKLKSAFNLSEQENQKKLIISEKMATLGRLTASIAHEMNTPLAAVRASIKELRELVDEYDKSIGNPEVTTDDHKLIANDMLNQLNIAGQSAEKSAAFIRGIKAQTIDITSTNLQLFNVAPVISDALNILEFALKKSACRLITNLDSSLQLYGDPRKLVQVITNLVMNSIDACKPHGGEISVTLRKTEDNLAEFRVQDTGCGIPEEIIPKIFDPMFTTKPFGEGTGLGLSIVHDLVNEYGGTIKVNSGNGVTSFLITLPLNKIKEGS